MVAGILEKIFSMGKLVLIQRIQVQVWRKVAEGDRR